MTSLLTSEDRIEIIKKVFQSTSSYYSGKEAMNLIPALKDVDLSLDAWMLWLDDPMLAPTFESEKRKSIYQKTFAANQIVDSTLAGTNGAPTTVEISVAKDIIQSTIEKEKENPFSIPNEQEIFEKMWDFYKSIQKRIDVEKSKSDK